MADDAASVTLEIKNEAGVIVRTVDLGAQGSGERDYTWDGKDTDGNEVANGAYTYEVTAQDAAGESIRARTFIIGQVDRVTFGAGGIQLWIGDTAIDMGNVSSVRDSE